MTAGPVLVEVDAAGIALLTVNRPGARNALNLEVVNAFRSALGELAGRDDLRALMVTGAGEKAFVSGADIAELRERTREDAFRRINATLFREVETFPRPTIAAVRGFALGAGCELAIACDLRVAGEGARFGQPEVSLGIIPGAGATYRLPPLIGAGRARELIYTGRIIDSAEALAIGLVNRVVPDADVIPVARVLAGEIARQSAAAVRSSKIALLAARDAAIEHLMALEAGLQASLFDDEEKKARMTAFLERRRAKG